MHNENLCPFDIWAPDRRCSTNNTAFSAYAFHQQQIEDVINELAAAANPNDLATQCAAYERAALNPEVLTYDEIKYMESEIAKRWYKI